MNKASLKYIIAVLFGFCAGMLVCKFQPVFAEIDLSDERASMIEDMNQQSEDIEAIQDVFGNDDLTEEDMTRILNGEHEAAIVKKEVVKVKEPVQVAMVPKEAPVKKEAPVVVQPRVEPVKEEKPVQVVRVPKETPKAAPTVATQVKIEEPVQVAMVPKEAPVKKEAPVVVQPRVEPVKEEKPVQVVRVPKETPKAAPTVTTKVIIEESVVAKPKVEPVIEEKPVQVAMIPKEASRKGPSKPVKKVSLKELKAQLGLTDSQVKRLTPIMKQKGDRRTEIIKKYAGKGEKARSAFIKEMQLFRQYYDDMYSHIMSEEQWSQYLQIREEQKNQAS